jgi:endogenous inhibitor of DNA gyrase (YacG/DUF329 family)
MTWTNPGPNARYCPECDDNVFWARVNPVLSRDVITLSSDCDWEIRCPLCGAKLEGTKI